MHRPPPPRALCKGTGAEAAAGEDLLGARGRAVYLPSLVAATVGGTTPQATDE